MELATFGSGCFWCTEAIFQRLDGVASVTPGYAGGEIKNPTYREVCSGRTGHAECVQISYDPSKVSFDTLLEVFWKTHDPTTPNRQGNDVGSQYRSVVFYHNEHQREKAESYKKQLDASGAWGAPIVTEIKPLDEFYEAENYHQNYYNEHGAEPYCSIVIAPKVKKFKEVFKDRLA
jgi:peptide-methionine (S)-S-oxide reductase